MLKWYRYVVSGVHVNNGFAVSLYPDVDDCRGTPPAAPDRAECLVVGKTEFDALVTAAKDVKQWWFADKDVPLSTSEAMIERLSEAIDACEEVPNAAE